MTIAMTIAGSDSGGGAGIQADVKTFQEHGVFGTTVITALTAQNTLGVQGIFPATRDFVVQQLTTVFEDIDVRAVKTGMLFSADIIEAVAAELVGVDLAVVVDPVMIAKGGASLLQQEATEALKTKLLPQATVCTPNIPEAEVLTGMKVETQEDVKACAQAILMMGVRCVVMKGGHLEGAEATDYVYCQDGTAFSVTTPRVKTKDTHGTGCTYSAAITANLANGLDLRTAIIEAKKFVHLAIATPLHIGSGHGPTNHFAYKRAGGVCEVRVEDL